MSAFLALVFGVVVAAILAIAVLVVIAKSFLVIGPAQVGLVTRRVSSRHNTTDDPITFAGEAGYQSELLMSGVRFKLWPTYSVAKYPWVQVPAGEIGVVISQIGAPLATGAKSAAYRPEFGNFTNLRAFLENGGQKGVQRPVLPPGTLIPVHPVAFLVITASKAYGLPVDKQQLVRAPLSAESFGLLPKQLRVTVIAPEGDHDLVGIVTTLDQERPPQQLPGLPGFPGQRRPDRAPARPASVRGVPAQSFPRSGRTGEDAGRQPGRGGGDQELCRAAHSGHLGARVQVRLDRSTRPPGHLARGAENGQVPVESAHLCG